VVLVAVPVLNLVPAAPGGGSGARIAILRILTSTQALGAGINGQLGDLAALEEAYRRQHELM
jgi:hypothetical protein